MKIKNNIVMLSCFYSASDSLVQKQRDPEQKHLQMTSCVGFTLIELLVVVLIIGILAAVSLPQYQLAVDKSRTVPILAVAQAVKEAQEAYYLANNSYTTDWNYLDVSLPGNITDSTLTNPGQWQIKLYQDTSSMPPSMLVYLSWLSGTHLLISYNHSSLGNGYQNKIFCYVPKTDSRGNELCKSLSSQTTPADYGGEYKYTIK